MKRHKAPQEARISGARPTHVGESGFTLVELLVVIAIIFILLGLTLSAVQASRESARRFKCAAQLGRIGMAIANYEDAYRFFPPGTIEKEGPIRHEAKGYHHNWLSFVLPYLDERSLARRIDRSASVYADANAGPRKQRVMVIECPSDAQAGTSFPYSSYAAVHHPKEAPIDVDNQGVFFLNSRVGIAEVRDGLSHALFLGERLTVDGMKDLGWMSGTRATLRNTGHSLETGFDRPASDPLAPKIVGGFGSLHPAVVQFVLGSGAVVPFSSSIDESVLQKLANRSDGELVPEELYLDSSL